MIKLLKFVSVMVAGLFAVILLNLSVGMTQTNVRSFKVQYSVPIDPAESTLFQVSKFEISDYQIDLTDESRGQVEMSYTMPKTLLGFDHNFRMYLVAENQTSGSTVREFAGRDSSATCSGAWDKMKCDVKFWVRPDLIKLEALLVEMGDPQRAQRLEISRRFGNDPIGKTEVQ